MNFAQAHLFMDVLSGVYVHNHLDNIAYVSLPISALWNSLPDHNPNPKTRQWVLTTCIR